jgi:hypothetical protein
MIFGAIGGMKIGRGNRSTRRKPAPAPLCPPQVPHDQTRARTRTLHYVRFEVVTAVAMKNAVFWDVAPCRSCVNRRFGGTYRLHLQGRKIRERGTSLSRWRQIPKYGILHTTLN